MGTARFDFAGQVVMVTGASGGIGAGLARRFAETGALVGVHYHANRAGAEALATEIGGKAFGADLGTEAGCTGLMADVAARLGPVDHLINNAGLQPVKAFAEIDGQDIAQLMAANLAAPTLLTRALARAGRKASVVNIASIEGMQPASGHSHYAASKAGLIMASRAAALELGPMGIRVNAISPGLIDTGGLEANWPEGVKRWLDVAPLGRLGRPGDIADAALFLCSDAADWITGANLVVDGGVLSAPTW